MESSCQALEERHSLSMESKVLQSIEIHSFTHVINLLFQNWFWSNEILFQGTQVLTFYFIVFKLIFIGIQLLYCVVLVSTVQQHESAICTAPFPFGLPSHLGHHNALGRVPVLCRRAHQLSILYTVSIMYMCQFQSFDSSHLCFSLGIHIFLLYICVSVSTLQIRSSKPFFQRLPWWHRS